MSANATYNAAPLPEKKNGCEDLSIPDRQECPATKVLISLQAVEPVQAVPVLPNSSHRTSSMKQYSIPASL